MKGMAHVDLDYCMFEDFVYQKPTRFWVPTPMARELAHIKCDGQCQSMVTEPDGKRHHRLQIGGKAPIHVSKEKAYRIPQAIVEYLCGIHQQKNGLAESPSDPQVQEVMVKPWHRKMARPFQIGRMERRGGCCQLMLEVEMDTGSKWKKGRALIDTGAQTSLVRRDVLPDSCFTQSRKPLLLRTVSGEELNGGKDEVTIMLSFEAHTEDGKVVNQRWNTMVTAHDGDIGCDLILGYPWLKVNRLDVQPWRDALQLHDSPRWVLSESKQMRNSQPTTAAVILQSEASIPLPSDAFSNFEVCLDECDEEESEVMAIIRKMRLRIPGEVDLEGDEWSDEEISDGETLEVVKQQFLNAKEDDVHVQGVVESEDEHPDPIASKLRKEILEEYTGRVFRDRVWPNPPARGTHGKAVLRLKPGAIPVVGRVINLKGERFDALREMEKECRMDQKLEPGRGPWRAAAFPIKKKNGKWRLVCDYSLTNQQLQPDSYPLPLTEDIVAEQARCEIFSTIDLRDAFHQVALDTSSRPITNIQMPGGLWQWTVVPQGINVGPALLQRDIDATCSKVQRHSRPYFDDIIISTKRQPDQTEEAFLRQHAAEVRETLDALENDKWVSDPKKVKLFMRRVEFVGHVLGGGRRMPAPGKLAAVQKWQIPQNVSSLRAFLGMCNYYSGYVRMFAEFAAPLQEKLKLPRELTRGPHTCRKQTPPHVDTGGGEGI